MCLFHFRAQLVDIVAATQTSASWEAAMELLDFNDEDQADVIEKFLVNAAFNSHPTEAQLQKIWVCLEDVKWFIKICLPSQIS